MITNPSVLLLNASNLKSCLVYPYAFVQVSEIADRHHIKVTRKDLFGIPQIEWPSYLQLLIDNSDPTMILITLRNTDTLGIVDYHASTDADQPYYFPVQMTKALIDTLRGLTDLKLAVGGFGFSLLPEEIMKYTRSDYGIFGGPDDFFDKFDCAAEGKELNQIANLYYWEGGELESTFRTFYPPAERGEYTETVVQEILAFRSRYSDDDSVTLMDTIAIENTRGCPHRCAFCAEPLVKGHQLYERDLGAIRADIDLLGKHGLNELFFTCSELNPIDNDFTMQVADLIIDINGKRSQDDRITWYASYMMTFSPEEMVRLKQSGFKGGWYDVISLDDENLETMRSPYDREKIVREIMKGIDVPLIEYGDPVIDSYSLQERIFANKPNLNPGSFFLGNPTITVKTIKETVRVMAETGLARIYENTGSVKATRVFDYLGLDDALLRHTWSREFGGERVEYRELYPSFSYPPALVDHFGNAEEVVEFFIRLESTFLSSRHLFEKDWHAFLNHHVNQEQFALWWESARKSGISTATLCAIPDVVAFLELLLAGKEKINILFHAIDSETERYRLVDYSAHMAIRYILLANEEPLKPVMQFLGFSESLPGIFDLTPYEITKTLFELYGSKGKLVTSLEESAMKSDLALFFVEYLLHLHNVSLESKYRAFFV